MRTINSSRVRSKASTRPTRTGSGIDQCRRWPSAGSSSWTLSQTAMITSLGLPRHRDGEGCGAASAACGAPPRPQPTDALQWPDECRPRLPAASCGDSTPPRPTGCAPNSGCRQTPPARPAMQSRAPTDLVTRGSTADSYVDDLLLSELGARSRRLLVPPDGGRSGSMTSTTRFEALRATHPRVAAGQQSPADRDRPKPRGSAPAATHQEITQSFIDSIIAELSAKGQGAGGDSAILLFVVHLHDGRNSTLSRVPPTGATPERATGRY